MEDIEVSIVKCPDYSEENVKKAMDETFKMLNILDEIKDGSKVTIKANLVSFMKPE